MKRYTSNVYREPRAGAQIIFAAIGSNGVSFRFVADMHPEKDATTLNKCKPQKV